jgi:hypothetical protein
MDIHDRIVESNDKYVQTLERIYKQGKKVEALERIKAFEDAKFADDNVSDNVSDMLDLSFADERKVSKKWEPIHQQQTCNSLIDAVVKLSNLVEPVEEDKYDIQVGNYRGIISAPGGSLDNIQIYYQGELAVTVKSENDLYLSNLVRPAATINQYETAFTNQIEIEIDQLGRQKEELDRRLEVERLAQIERDNLAQEQSLIEINFDEDVNINFGDEPAPDQGRSSSRTYPQSPNR